MTQTSDILEAIRGAGIPLNTTQLAEQLPHIPKPSISAVCSQLRQQGVLTGAVEDGRVAFRVVAGAGPSDAYNVNVNDEAADAGDDEPAGAIQGLLSEDVKPIDVGPAAVKPPTQSFSPRSMERRQRREPDMSIEISQDPRSFSAVLEALTSQGDTMRRYTFDRDEPEKDNTQANPELAAVRSERPPGTVTTRPARNDGRLCRELAAAVLARWPGEIPYDVQRLVNSAATLPL